MKKRVLFYIMIAVIAIVGCGGKDKVSPKVVTEDGEMIEILSPVAHDTFSWALVTGNASVKQGLFHVELLDEYNEVLARRSVLVESKAPDTSTFETSVSAVENSAPQEAKIKAYSLVSENNGSTEAAMIPVYLIPGPAAAQGTISRFYKSLDTNGLDIAYELLVPEEATYPNFYQGEISFAGRPAKPEDLAGWKKENESIRLLALLRASLYDLPQEDLFVYRGWVEHVIGEQKNVEETYIFLKRDQAGRFLMYRPRADMYKPD